jgi:hypothetical protein
MENCCLLTPCGPIRNHFQILLATSMHNYRTGSLPSLCGVPKDIFIAKVKGTVRWKWHCCLGHHAENQLTLQNDTTQNNTETVSCNKQLLRNVLNVLDYEIQCNTFGIFCNHRYTEISLTLSEGLTAVLLKIKFFLDVTFETTIHRNTRRYIPEDFIFNLYWTCDVVFLYRNTLFHGFDGNVFWLMEKQAIFVSKYRLPIPLSVMCVTVLG